MRSIGYLFKEGIKSLWKNRTMSIASIAVLMSCLLITGIAVLISLNMDNTMQSIEEENNITVYLNDGTPKLTAIKIGDEIRNYENILSCDYIAGEDAILSMMESMGEDGILFEGFEDILPDAYQIKIRDLSRYDETISQISQIEGVDEITDYSDVAEKLSDLDELIGYGSIAIVSVLAIVALFIISNTLKVTMFTRRVEINIMKSVGATNAFVRVPFIVEGILIGLISGALSSTILYFSYGRVTEAVYTIVPFISIFDIEPYTIYIFSAYGIIGIMFGLIGGLISISRYLKREGENAIF